MLLHVKINLSRDQPKSNKHQFWFDINNDNVKLWQFAANPKHTLHRIYHVCLQRMLCIIKPNESYWQPCAYDSSWHNYKGLLARSVMIFNTVWRWGKRQEQKLVVLAQRTIAEDEQEEGCQSGTAVPASGDCYINTIGPWLVRNLTSTSSWQPLRRRSIPEVATSGWRKTRDRRPYLFGQSDQRKDGHKNKSGTGGMKEKS